MPSTVVFHSPTYGRLSLRQTLSRVAAFIGEDPSRPYRIAVGSDSVAKSRASITTVLVVHRLGSGAMYAYTRGNMQRFTTLRDRIFAEAMASITLGQEIRGALKDEFGESGLADHDIEIHADVGYNGPMRSEVESLMGMARGFDFIPVIKPDAYAACTIADRHA